MCRSRSTETIRLNHFSLQDDRFGVTFFQTKTDQEGAEPKEPRHCFANPLSPSTCVMLALSIYLACCLQLGCGALFPGSKQKDRLGTIFSKIIAELTGNGSLKVASCGTHSIRKGVSTFACSGSTGGPSIVSVCLRCGWSLGDVIERYIRYESAGDQYLGRVVAGLQLNNREFALLPPHFDSSQKDPVVQDCIRELFPNIWNVDNFRGIPSLCLASLVYHSEFLLSTLSPTHSLLSTPLFQNKRLLECLKPLVISGYESPVIWASGIPPHVEIYNQLHRNHEAIQSIPSIVVERISDVLDEKGVASGNITRELLESTIQTALSNIVNAQSITTSTVIQVEQDLNCVYSWGGRFHRLPEDFEFPSVDVASAWRLWWLGNSFAKHPPYRLIDTRDLSTRKKTKEFSSWKYLMTNLIACYQEHCPTEVPNPKSSCEVSRMFTRASECLEPLKQSTAKNRERRFAQLKVLTVAKLLREMNGAASSPSAKKRKSKPK